MSEAIPNLYTWRSEPSRLPLIGRVLALALAALALGVLVVAASIRPSPAGVGSHEQIGLNRCQFHARSGVPCPTCGMTTSFAHFVRGNLAASLYVQPMATLLAGATALGFWGALYVGVTGRPAHRLLRFIRPSYYILPLMAGLVLAWAWKIWIHVRGLDGWGT